MISYSMYDRCGRVAEVYGNLVLLRLTSTILLQSMSSTHVSVVDDGDGVHPAIVREQFSHSSANKKMVWDWLFLCRVSTISTYDTACPILPVFAFSTHRTSTRLNSVGCHTYGIFFRDGRRINCRCTVPRTSRGPVVDTT